MNFLKCPSFSTHIPYHSERKIVLNEREQAEGNRNLDGNIGSFVQLF